MPELVSTPKFERAYARHTKRNAVRRQCVDQALARLAVNPLDPRLKMHPLSADLAGYHACSCGYDCGLCSCGTGRVRGMPFFSSTSERMTKYFS